MLLVLLTSLAVFDNVDTNEQSLSLNTASASNGCKLDLDDLIISPIPDSEAEASTTDRLQISPLLEYVITLPCKHKYLALFDTGAQISVINESLAVNLAKEFPGMCKIRTMADKLKVGAMNGSQEIATKQINLSFKLGAFAGSHTFVLCPNLNRDVILGLDFAVNENLNVDFM